jgi:hypothetical protein
MSKPAIVRLLTLGDSGERARPRLRGAAESRRRGACCGNSRRRAAPGWAARFGAMGADGTLSVSSAGAGKSSLLLRYTQNEFTHEYMPTIG